MAEKEPMGWVASMKRWQKRYRGKLYTVSPRQLGIEPRSKAASRSALPCLSALLMPLPYDKTPAWPLSLGLPAGDSAAV